MGRTHQAVVERDPRLAVAYVRVSTEEQAERGLSLEGQLSELRSYAVANGVSLADFFVERGASGRDDTRPEFRRMLDAVLTPDSRIGAVLVVHSSRFARSAEHAAVYAAKLARASVQLIATQQPVSAGPEGRLMRTIYSAIDEYESENIGRRTRAGMKATVRAGYFVGSQPPFGFRAVSAVGPGGAPKKKLEVAPDEAAIARAACGLYVTRGGIAVAAELNVRGLLYRGRLWDRDRVLRVVSDTALVGEYVWGRVDSRTGRERPPNEWVTLPVEPIIERDLFDRVRAERERRDPDRNPGREASSPLLLAGLVRCGRCGARYQLQTSGKLRPDGSRYEFVQCSVSRRRGVRATGSCPGNPIPVDAIDAAVIEHLLTAAFSPARCRALLHDLVEREGILRNRVAAERRQGERERADLERRRARLVEAIESSDAAPAGIVERLAEVEQRLREARDRLNKILVLHDAPLRLDDPATLQAFRVGMIEAIRSRPEIVRAHLHGFGVRVTVGPGGIIALTMAGDETVESPTARPLTRRAAS